MKFYELALFLFILNVFGMAFTSVGLYEEMGFSESFELGGEATTMEELEQVEEGVRESMGEEVMTGDDPVTYTLGLMYSAVERVTTTIFTPLGALTKYIFWPKIILLKFGVPAQIGNAVTLVFGLIQVIGIAQFLTGRGFKEME